MDNNGAHGDDNGLDGVKATDLPVDFLSIGDRCIWLGMRKLLVGQAAVVRSTVRARVL